MSKVVVRIDTVDGFFARAKDAARKADQAQAFDGKVTLSFEDPQRMFTVLSEARRRLMSEVMREPQTIKELTSRLHRNRSAVTKDVGRQWGSPGFRLNRSDDVVDIGCFLSKFTGIR